VTSLFAEALSARSVVRQLIAQQLLLRYRRTFLGYLWTLISPLLMMTVMAAVFSSLLRSNLKDFVVFLFAAMIPWNFFSALVTQAGGCFINNEGLIKKIYVPKLVFPISLALALLVDSVFSFIALFIIILLTGAQITAAVGFLLISYALLFLFAFGAGLVMSIATVFFRDLQHVTLIAMQGLFFLSPILYNVDALSGPIGLLVKLNPVVPFIQLFRFPLYYGAVPPAATIAQAVVLALISLLLGLVVFARSEKQIVFRL
jgi:ABC-type polysaccharide/polyol phosphate export permease